MTKPTLQNITDILFAINMGAGELFNIAKALKTETDLTPNDPDRVTALEMAESITLITQGCKKIQDHILKNYTA